MPKKKPAKFWIVSIVIALAFADGFAAESDPDKWMYTCVAWNRHTEIERMSFVHGWLQGVTAADQATSEEIMSMLWPRGHRVGGVVIEMDVECGKPANRNAALMHVMMQIAKRLNGVRE